MRLELLVIHDTQSFFVSPFIRAKYLPNTVHTVGYPARGQLLGGLVK